MFDLVVELLSASALTYVIVLASVTFDAVVPVLPSETILITGGVLAARGDLSLALIVAAGTAGALLGDNITYTLGSRTHAAQAA